MNDTTNIVYILRFNRQHLGTSTILGVYTDPVDAMLDGDDFVIERSKQKLYPWRSCDTYFALFLQGTDWLEVSWHTIESMV